MPASATSAAIPPADEAGLSTAGELSLWQRLREQGDVAARQALINHHLPYTRIVAASYYGRRMHNEIEFAEYLQLACLGMMESVDRYNPALGAQFKTFAARRMHGAILDGLERITEKQQQIAARQRLRQERLQAAKAAALPAAADPSAGRRSTVADDLFRTLAEVGIGLALGILLEGTGMVESDTTSLGPETHQPYRQQELAQLRRQIGDMVALLLPQQRSVVQRHYLHEHSFGEIAQQMGLTKGRVSQIHRQALEALRHALTRRDACDIAW